MDGSVQVLDLKSGELATSLTLPSQVSPLLVLVFVFSVLIILSFRRIFRLWR
jgi:hypothetical protein